jgi:hypothetical protein
VLTFVYVSSNTLQVLTYDKSTKQTAGCLFPSNLPVAMAKLNALEKKCGLSPFEKGRGK